MADGRKVMRFRDLKAPMKMTVAFSVVLAAIAAAGAILYLNLAALERADANMARTNQVLRATEGARFALARQENSLRGYLLSGETFYIDRIMGLHRPLMLSNIEEMERLNGRDPAGRERVARLKNAFEAWRRDGADAAIVLAADPSTRPAAIKMIGEKSRADLLMDRTEDALAAIEVAAHGDLAQQAAVKAAAARHMKLALILGVALAALIAAAMGLALAGSIADPIVALTRVMRRLAAGDNGVDVPALARRDEIGHMAAAVATFREAAIAKAALEAEAEARRRESLALAAQAQAASRAKSEFLATMTHELRTPLNGILGMAQIMDASALPPAQRKHLATIRESGNALLRVINDILDISKIEAGRLEILPAPFDLGRFADDMTALYRPLAEDKGLTFNLRISPAARGWFLGDAVRLRQVASNLISNALKFTRAGEVNVDVDVVAARLRFTVSDTGLGVPVDQQPFLFDRFTQADASATRRFGGTGLGLAICKEIVELLGGAITFQSLEGVGSRFSFEVPLPPADAEGAGAQDGPAGTGGDLRVLIVDDNPTNQTVLAALLEQFGVVTHGVSDGAEAVAAWEAEPWDAILMDIHMPKMDGVTATLRIRESEEATGRARTPIIAVTASALSHETESYRSAGMDDCVAKPIEARTVMGALQKALAA